MFWRTIRHIFLGGRKRAVYGRKVKLISILLVSTCILWLYFISDDSSWSTFSQQRLGKETGLPVPPSPGLAASPVLTHKVMSTRMPIIFNNIRQSPERRPRHKKSFKNLTTPQTKTSKNNTRRASVEPGWQTVLKDNIWLYSAYLDRRVSPPWLTIFGIIEKNFILTAKFRCKIRDHHPTNNSGAVNEETVSVASISNIDPYHRVRYSATVILCRVGRVWDANISRTVTLESVEESTKGQKFLPHNITITVLHREEDPRFPSPKQSNADRLKQVRDQRAGILHEESKPINISKKPENPPLDNSTKNKNTRETENKITKADDSILKSTDIVDFSVCIPPFFHNYSDIMEFVEMIEVSRMFGAKRFTLYNMSMGAEMMPYIDYYRSKGVVEVLPWNLPWPDTDVIIHKNIHYFGEVVALNDCLYRNTYRTQFLSMTDIDEIIVPKTFDNWPSMLKYLRSASSYDFQCTFFRKEHKNDAVMDGNNLVKALELRTLLKTERDVKIFPHNQRSKQLIRPHLVTRYHIHFATSWLRPPSGMVRTHHVHESTALLYHYRAWNETLPQHFTNRRMHTFRNDIIFRVEAVHYDVNFGRQNSTKVPSIHNQTSG